MNRFALIVKWFKRFFLCGVILILVLTACSQYKTGFECKKGICIRIEIEGPVDALVPARYVISVKSERNISELPIGLTVFPGIRVSDIEKIPENAKLVYQDETTVDWNINTKGGDEYTISGYIVLSKPTASYGIFSYTVLAFFSQPTFGRVIDSITIYLDAKGKQVEESKARMEMQTEFPVPTPPPDLTIVPETPLPTVNWPSATPALTPTQPAYPASDEKESIPKTAYIDRNFTSLSKSLIFYSADR